MTRNKYSLYEAIVNGNGNGKEKKQENYKRHFLAGGVAGAAGGVGLAKHLVDRESLPGRISRAVSGGDFIDKVKGLKMFLQ